MYRTLLGIIGSLVAALLLVGLTFSASKGGQAEFRFINGTEPKSLDPQLATGEPEGRVLSALFEGLTRRDAATLQPIPGVAQSWDLSADEQRYTFHLRADARWSNGTPVTASDFVYSWKRLLDPALGAEYAYLIFMIRHAEAFNTFGAQIEALQGPIPQALSELQQRNPGEVQAAELQRTLAASNAHAALQHAVSPLVGELLGRRQGQVNTAELTQFIAQLGPEAKRLKKELQAAQAHLGVDQGFFATDDRTLVVELRSPTPYFLELMAFYPSFPVPRALLEAPKTSRDWFLPENMVNNGAFNLERWVVNDRIRLVRSETYWGRAHVKLSSADALPIENAATALNLYLTGEVHWLPSLYPTELVHRFRKRNDFYAAPAMIVYYYRINCERGPLRDKRVRQALNLAVNREIITTNVLGLGQVPADYFVPPGMPGYQRPKTAIRFDPERARHLLAEAGYPAGKGFPEIGILYNTLEQHKKIAEVISDQLRTNLGISVNAYNQEWQSFLATTRSGDYDIARAGWVGDYADPNTFLDLWVTNGGNNQTGFSSPAYDALLRAASDPASAVQNPERALSAVADRQPFERLFGELQNAPTPASRSPLLRTLRLMFLSEAEALLVQDEFPIIPIYFYVNSGFISPKVSGFYKLGDEANAPNPQDIHPLYSIAVAP